MRHDPLADALSKMKNAQTTGKKDCIIMPSSKLIGWVLKTMQEHGYVKQYEYIDDGRAGVFKVKLSGTLNDCGVIKPRFSLGLKEFERFESRYLPAQDFGILILTTPKGVMSHHKARENHVGGRILAFVY